MRITVADEGVGFASQDKAYVFEVLRKGEADSPGLGIGLAMCRKVVENHRGTISIDSEPGRGTRVTFLLPLRQQAPARG